MALWPLDFFLKITKKYKIWSHVFLNPTRMRSAWCSSKETIFGRSDCVMETTVTISRAHKQKLNTSHVDQQNIRLANIIEMLLLVEWPWCWLVFGLCRFVRITGVSIVWSNCNFFSQRDFNTRCKWFGFFRLVYLCI